MTAQADFQPDASEAADVLGSDAPLDSDLGANEAPQPDSAAKDSDFVSYGGKDEDEFDDDDGAGYHGGSSTATLAPARVEKVVTYDLARTEPISFAALIEARSTVYQNKSSYKTFAHQVDDFGTTGEQGRLKGLGLWVLARYEDSVAMLVNYSGDDVADFTRAKSLMALGQFKQAEQLFKRLADAYPDEPRPLGGLVDARLRAVLKDENDEAQVKAAIDLLDRELEDAPESFRTSAEGHYMAGRMLELERDYEAALEHYSKARELDITLRDNLVHGAYLAERCGLDDLAIRMYESLVEQHLADRGAMVNLGVLYEDIGRDEDAAACYDVLLKADPTDDRARAFLEDARSAMDMYYDEDLERKEDKLNQILRIPITDFELSVRARNCLNKMQIHTLGDLVTKTEQELMSYKNFGETSLNEIKEILRTKALRLGMPREEAVASIESRARRPVSSSDPSDLSNKPISDLQLSIRARRTVEALGCLTVADVIKHSADELLGMPNFGTTSLQELRGKLNEMNAKLAGD